MRREIVIEELDLAIQDGERKLRRKRRDKRRKRSKRKIQQRKWKRLIR